MSRAHGIINFYRGPLVNCYHRPKVGVAPMCQTLWNISKYQYVYCCADQFDLIVINLAGKNKTCKKISALREQMPESHAVGKR